MDGTAKDDDDDDDDDDDRACKPLEHSTLTSVNGWAEYTSHTRSFGNSSTHSHSTHNTRHGKCHKEEEEEEEEEEEAQPRSTGRPVLLRQPTNQPVCLLIYGGRGAVNLRWQAAGAERKEDTTTFIDSRKKGNGR